MIEITDSDRAAIEAAWDSSHSVHGREQAIYRAGIAAGLERAAKVCEQQDATINSYNNPLNGLEHPVAKNAFMRCAAAIRALKGGHHEAQ